MKTKKIIIISSITVLVIAALALGLFIYKNHQQKVLIEETTTEINAFCKKINSEQNRNIKIELLADFIKKSQEYKKQEKHLSEISEKCLGEITKIKAIFKEEYNRTLAEHTLEDIENITNKAVLNSAIDGLNSLSKLLGTENTITLTSDEYSKISAKIEALKNQYSTKISEIEAVEKAEEERLKKEAEEKARKEAEGTTKKAAEETKKNQNSSTENTSANSNNSNSNENSSSNDNKPNNSSDFNTNGMVKSWDTTEDGTEIEGTTTYHDKNGNVYDENGNHLGNLEEWATDW